ncbi:MAG: SMC-Scp complex subunit ScpB [Bacteroidetes bacterium]|nr:SMC-Scp complex subunit ScpB [Bacteroidota bacterium]
MTELPLVPELSHEDKRSVIEALIFASDEPLTSETLFQIMQLDNAVFGMNESDTENPTEEQVLEYFTTMINEINEELASTTRPYRIVTVAGGFHFATMPEQGEYVQKLLKSKSRRRLSQASLETLAIISYRQPISKPEIESIRGVNSNEIVNSLMEKNLVAIIGRAEVVGKPLLYGTTPEFLRVFGLNALTDLPKLREIEELLEQRQQAIAIQAESDIEIPQESPSEPKMQSENQ